MAAYTTDDAMRELSQLLAKPPAGAVRGEWEATTMQAGHSSRTGGYRNADGGHVEEGRPDSLSMIGEIVEKLEAGAAEGGDGPGFNKVVIRWKKPKIPFMRGQVTLETSFDRSIVPRGVDDPVYEAAAAARRAFWQERGAVDAGFAAERGAPNSYNQTKWFGPHRRVLSIRGRGADGGAVLLLATDGLSTPWAGIADPENGVECELFMEFADNALDAEGVAAWGNLLISLGDLVADGHRVARDVEKHGAILFCRLTEDYRPMTRVMLSRDPGRIEGLPFGAVPLIRATPVADAELQGQDLDEEWGVTAAKSVLASRGLAL
ncbi:hypothetical protein GCM10010520_63090 [Rhizobium viscosum]|uniref:Suppressor of fused protein (SUFU) n=1 Tax=Rhizobium viscosum TaxID=1673 RepID=A0ABR9IUZ2_RHIVS|nr:hypothetical protein [Rhizobium viscosum]MBE1507003.1 hypothetical protein [Rhizobium viscosum]